MRYPCQYLYHAFYSSRNLYFLIDKLTLIDVLTLPRIVTMVNKNGKSNELDVYLFFDFFAMCHIDRHICTPVVIYDIQNARESRCLASLVRRLRFVLRGLPPLLDARNTQRGVRLLVV